MENGIANTVKFNEHDYVFEVRVTVFDQRGKSGRMIFDSLLNVENVLNLELVSDLKLPFLVGSLEYLDVGPSVFNRVSSDGTSFVSVLVKKVDGMETSIEFFHEFVVDNVSVISQEYNSCTFSIAIASVDSLKFDNFLAYSSYGSKECVKMVKEMLIKSGLSVKDPTTRSETSFEFISHANSTMTESIRYVLSNCHSRDRGLFVLLFDHLSRRYSISALNEVFSRGEVKEWNTFSFPTAEESEEVSELKVGGLKSRGYLTLRNRLKKIMPVKFQEFDYDRRSWKNIVYSRDQISQNVIPPAQDSSYRIQASSVPGVVPNDVKRDRRETYVNEYDFYEAVLDSVILSDCLEFRTIGNLRRGPGQLVGLLVSEKSRFAPMFNGRWFSSRVFHRFSRGSYINVLQVCRTDERK